ncbi:MAG: alpha-galactosidase, partial [Anaerolineaceae bacterium]|nr:alpha-galactosidase [Anaerolineaceae bacterium]
MFDGWFSALGIHNRMPPLKGYSSWYNHYTNINTQRILEDLNGARKLFSEGDLFQIDDGWESAVGDWKTVNERKFPDGLRPVTERIHRAGFMAGLWLAPFSCEKKSKLFKNHPGMLLKYQDKPWKNGPNWSGHYSLDIDRPEVIDYLAGVFRRIFEEWKFDLVKLDFLYAAAPLAGGDHGNAADIPFSESRASRMIRAMKLL